MLNIRSGDLIKFQVIQVAFINLIDEFKLVLLNLPTIVYQR